MNRIEHFQQLMDLGAKVRNLREGFVTNFYPDVFKHQVWISKQALFYEEYNKTVFFIKENSSFRNLFYISTSIEELHDSIFQLLRQHKDKQVVMDIVGRDVQCRPIVDMLRSVYFVLTTSLVRMQRITSAEDIFPSMEGIRPAEGHELEEISDCLHEYFDDRLEQIPYDEELQEYIKNGYVLVAKDKNRLSGFLIFEKNASTLYLRYWFTKPECREHKVGSKLLRQFFCEGLSTKRQILWVIEKNENAIKRYVHYGFRNENMYDYIMIWNPENK